MNHQLRRVVLSFLAGRSPAAYSARAIAQRISGCGMLDAPVGSDAVEDELRLMAARDRWVLVEVDPVTKEAGWFASDAGVQQWVLNGRLAVD